MSMLTICRIGASLGVALPADLIDALGLNEGDARTLSVTPSGLQLSVIDPLVAAQLDAGREAMQRYQNAVRELAT